MVYPFLMNETEERADMSNTITVKDQFTEWKKQAKSTIGKAKKELDALVEPIQRNLKLNTIGNIPQDFGKFLYSCLGERVTGQRSSVLNATFFKKNSNGIALVEKAKEKKCTIEEYLQKHDFSTDWRGNKHYRDTQGFITAGRRFGVSYYTGDGERTHTIYFEDGKVFEFLTQEHVDCIKNSLKKECTQAFLDYRDAFVKNLATMNQQDNIIEINVPVTIARIVTLSTRKKYDRGGDYNDSLSATVVESTHNETVQFATLEVPEFEIWDKASNVESRDARRGISAVHPFVAIRFGSVTDDKTPVKDTIQFGGIDISSEQFSHTLNTVEANRDDLISPVSATGNAQEFHTLFNKIPEKDRYYARRNGTQTDGVMLNMKDLFLHTELQKAIQKRVDFFIAESVKLQELKHKFAGMYFLNSD